MSKYTKEDFNVDTNGVIRWNSSNNVPPTDILTEFLTAGFVTQEEVLRSISMSKIEQEAALRAYVEMRNKYGYTNEEKFEMRAAFGDEEIVDFFTGKRIAF